MVRDLMRADDRRRSNQLRQGWGDDEIEQG